MCLSVPMRITEIQGQLGQADIGGVSRQIDLRFLEDVGVGDYVIVHAGFALQKLDRREAEETLALLREMLELDETSR
jgi:hydrogenase expression/formation protein HypC